MVTQKKVILILGSNSFVGKAVVNLLKITDHLFWGIPGEKDTDMRDYNTARKVIKLYQPTEIINCLSHVGGMHYVMKYGADVVTDNMRVITNLYDSVNRNIPKAKIINFLSNCSYPGDATVHYEPNWEKGPVHETVLSYGSTRRMIYVFSECFNKQYGVKSVNWLVANHYGPGDHKEPDQVHALNGIIIRMIKAQKANDKTFEIWGSGNPLREWIYVNDLAKILVHSLNIEEQIYPVNLAQKRGYSIKQIAKLVSNILNYKVEFIFNKEYPDGAPIKILDNQHFRRNYSGFKFTPLKKGIRDTVDYYKSIL